MRSDYKLSISAEFHFQVEFSPNKRSVSKGTAHKRPCMFRHHYHYQKYSANLLYTTLLTLGQMLPSGVRLGGRISARGIQSAFQKVDMVVFRQLWENNCVAIISDKCKKRTLFTATLVTPSTSRRRLCLLNGPV